MEKAKNDIQLKINQQGENLLVSGIQCLDLRQTLDCGQAFRFTENPDGTWQGIAHRKLLKLGFCNQTLTIFNMGQSEFESVWRRYLDLDRDYESIANSLCKNHVLKKAVAYANGIRVLKQDPWEALCSFIISQNNNVPRIKGIISRLCEAFGDPVPGGYAFPDASALADKTVEDLAVIRAGFRAKYILDASRKVVAGEVDLAFLHTAPLEEALQMLMRIHGVGPKVAECALLYGCGRLECFPKDVWIKRAIKVLFGGSLPDCVTAYAGIAQQYLFYFARETKLKLE